MSRKITSTAALAGVLALAALPAFANMNSSTMKAPDAEAHFKAIAKGDVATIMQQYAPNANFEWIGGPLDGNYSGTSAIQGVWQKFTKAGGAMKVKVTDIVVGGNPKGMTVTANVTFMGQKTIPVRYVLAYRGSKIVDEIWQIAPKMAMK